LNLSNFGRVICFRHRLPGVFIYNDSIQYLVVATPQVYITCKSGLYGDEYSGELNKIGWQKSLLVPKYIAGSRDSPAMNTQGSLDPCWPFSHH
jgi:hypothetical protein